MPSLMPSLILLASGAILTAHGLLSGDSSHLNLGLGALLLSLILYTFKSEEYVRRDALELVSRPLSRILDSIISDLELEGDPIFIPPFGEISKGGTFIPLHRDFELDLTRMSYEFCFLSSAGSERQIGIFLRSPGEELVERYEEHHEAPLEGLSARELESICDAVLRSLELGKNLRIREEESIEISFEPLVELSESAVLPDPVSSSVLSALSKATGELIRVRSYERGRRIRIAAEKIGGVERWM